jgi:hypothetical protein
LRAASLVRPCAVESLPASCRLTPFHRARREVDVIRR